MLIIRIINILPRNCFNVHFQAREVTSGLSNKAGIKKVLSSRFAMKHTLLRKTEQRKTQIIRLSNSKRKAQLQENLILSKFVHFED